MTLKQIYDLALKLGIENDLRGVEKVKKHLKRVQKRYEGLSGRRKEYFDKEKLTNPYSDTRILYDNGSQVERVMAGIDIDPQEIILAKMLGYDTVISHHPEGIALANLSDVMHLQAEVLAQEGVPINIAESMTKERVSEVSRGLSPVNHYRSVDAARLLDINFMCVHTPADNMAATFLKKLLDKKKPEIVGDIMDALMTVPEYQNAAMKKSGPRIFVGSEENSTGRIALTEITGGTSNSKDLYEIMSQVGIGTIVGMHMSEEHKREAQRNFVNVVIAGHMSSDSLGMNHFLDELEGKVSEIKAYSGLIRVNRKGNKVPSRKIADSQAKPRAAVMHKKTAKKK